jgi:diguanylate cyclase (GGDEF)-like protein
VIKKLSLRSALILPYVSLVVALALAIGSLSYFTGNHAVRTVSDLLLKETVNRISQAVDSHITGSAEVLETAFPRGMTAPDSIEADLDNIRTRLWTATSLHPGLNNYVYYGNRAGQAVGLYRLSADEVEMRVKYQAAEHRKRYLINGIAGKPSFSSTEEQLFDPRQRPWYRAAVEARDDIWTPVYIDFGTRDLITTRARSVPGSNGAIEGVVATDLPLLALNNFISSLEISEHGLAFIMEPDGNLIASSLSPNIQQDASGKKSRVNAATSGNPLLTEIYNQLQPHLSANRDHHTPRTFSFTDSNGEKIYAAFNRSLHGPGLDWINIVAIPGKDFLAGISKNVYRTLLLAIVATVLVILIGLWVLRWVTADLKILSTAVNGIGRGNIGTPIDIKREDEIGLLAKSFAAMQHRLQTDHLTGLPNRYAFEQHLQSTIASYQSQQATTPFAIFFVDINNFKLVNDRFGHTVGDQTLIEIGRRLRGSVRQNDYVARYAGDEFVLLLSDVRAPSGLETIRDNIEKAMAAPLDIVDIPSLKINAAIGEAHFPGDADTAADLIVFADKNMYAHKAAIKAGQRSDSDSGESQ